MAKTDEKVSKICQKMVKKLSKMAKMNMKWSKIYPKMVKKWSKTAQKGGLKMIQFGPSLP